MVFRYRVSAALLAWLASVALAQQAPEPPIASDAPAPPTPAQPPVVPQVADPAAVDPPAVEPPEADPPADALPSPEIGPLQTVAESSGFTKTASYDQVQEFLDELAARSLRVHLDSIGTTTRGRAISLAIIADPPIASYEEARKSGKLVVLLFGNIHAGEVCGKEALLMLARQVALADEPGVLDDLILCIVPIYNADGNEAMAPDNRPGQLGPDTMGERANAMGLDLNRDYLKLEAPETRALVRFMTQWDPAVIVDTHTTNGSHHQYVLTYQGPKHPAGDATLLSYVRDTMLPAIDESFEQATGDKTFFYGNFEDNHTRWTTYPAEPRYGVAYRGLRNRISILTEAYAYATYEQRVRATLAFCEQILNYSVEHADEIRALEKRADERTIAAGNDPSGEGGMIPLRIGVRAFDKPVEVLGFEQSDEDGTATPPGEPRAYEVEFVNLFEPTLSVRRPWAYVIPQRLEPIALLLARHGIEVQVLREDIEVNAQAYRLGAITRSERPYEGHRMVTGLEAFAMPRTQRLVAGSYIVRTGQRLGSLVAYMLEPQSSDGLVAWNFLDDELSAGGEYPILRLPEATPMTLRSARPLPEDHESAKRVTFEVLYEAKKRLNLSGNPVGGLRWVDDEHYLQRKGSAWHTIHALTGRSEPVAMDTKAIASHLAALATIDEDQAKKIAGRSFASPSPAEHGIVFTHAGDLYFAQSDGTGAIRLTSSPQTEELAQLSPDGVFVAFVRENDLWVVSIADARERQLTTGGTDELRHGKADWVYYEELLGRRWRAFWWSPDAKHIALLMTDASAVPTHTLVHDGPEPQRIETTRYPKPGQPNPKVAVGIISPAGGPVRMVDLSDYDEGQFLVTRVAWAPDSTALRLAVQDRAQTWLDLLSVKPTGGKPTRWMRETTEAWVTPQDQPRPLRDGTLLMLSERDGWKHLYKFDADGEVVGRVTRGEYEVRRVVHLDEDAGWVYFEGTVDSPIASNLYRVALDGLSPPMRLTHERGSHRISMNPAGDLFIDTWSNFDTPTRVALRSASGVLLRMIDTNPVYELDEYELGRMELVDIPSTQGVTLQGAVIYPPRFDPSRAHPVWFRTYGGPHAPTIRDGWQGGRLFDQMLANMGIVVFLGDPYPASGKGAVSAWTAYKQLGVREMQDIEELIAWVTDHPWADASRVGMSGHSYGGFMTSYAMTHSTLFKAGIAGAPVTSWRDYDSIYTERYMHTPQHNPDGYAGTSVADAAKNLHGTLLILHGTMDNNVHPQNSVRLVAALQKAGKDFQLMLYPGSRHGIFGKHYNRLVHNFIRSTMLEGEAEGSPEPTPEPVPEKTAETTVTAESAHP